MNQGKVASRADVQRQYACINWKAHLVPLLRQAVAEFAGRPEAKDYRRAHVTLLSEAAGRNEVAVDTTASLGDSVTIQFWAGTAATAAAGAAGYSRPLMVAGKAALVFSQVGDSGAVAVFFYPPTSSHGKATQPYYLVDRHDNPAAITRARVRKLLHDLFEIDLCHSNHATHLGPRGLRLAEVEARAAVIEGIGAGLAGYVASLAHMARGLWCRYRAAAAAPRAVAHSQIIRVAVSHAYKFARPPRFGRIGEPIRMRE
jgi:hypothetical protein